MSNQMKTTLFIPTYNELEGAKLIMPRINREWVDEIIVVDGGSTDGTIEYFEERGFNVVHQKSKGVCGAYWECFEKASCDVIIPFSPDNNSVPELIPLLITEMEKGNDMVIASRYLPGARSEDDDVVTAFGNWIFTKAVNILFGGQYTDSLVMFRAFRRDLIELIRNDSKKIPIFEYLLCIRCARHKKRVTEIPGDEPKRVGSVRKMKPLYNGSTLLWVLFKELFIKA